MTHTLGSVGFFSTYRPPLPLDLFSLSRLPSLLDLEAHLTDGKSYNYNGQVIPSSALKLMLQRPLLASVATAADVDAGRVSGLMMVSERSHGLETLHIVLNFGLILPVKIFSFAEVYGTYNEVRMEDSCVFAGEYIVYVTTKDPAPTRRQPWTAVYKTHLVTGDTLRLTPQGTADLSPAVSPNGSKIAVASFEGKEGGWQGEIENLMTNIFVFDINTPSDRTMIISNGGWPSWGSDNVIFFHRKLDDTTGNYWAVFRADLTNPSSIVISQVTPNQIKAFTPSAIDEHTVVVDFVLTQELFERAQRLQIDAQMQTNIDTWKSLIRLDKMRLYQLQNRRNLCHFNPFVIRPINTSNIRIGYHRGVITLKNPGVVQSQQLMNLQSPNANLGLFRVSGVFPTFSKDGTKLAFVDNEFLAVWVTDIQGPLRVVYRADQAYSVFAPIWSQDPEKDILYFCSGPSFNAGGPVDIMAIFDASSLAPSAPVPIVQDGFNNTFPCTNPDGTRVVYRSTRGGGTEFHKNLYIREEAYIAKPVEEIVITRLTDGAWTDTQCDWSPNGKWIVFSSTRDKPADAPPLDNGLDPGYFAVYLLAVNSPSVVIRVLQSGSNLAGHVNHPFFSPYGNSIVVTSDLAAVSCDPISLPLFNHSVRPYGDIFTVDIDPDDIISNQDVETVSRTTHSKFENSTCTWTVYSTDSPGGFWNLLLSLPHILKCPFAYPDGSEGWQMTGHLCFPSRQC